MFPKAQGTGQMPFFLPQPPADVHEYTSDYYVTIYVGVDL
jgi:hypothetical protein